MGRPDDSGDRPAWAPPAEEYREQRSTVGITVVLFAVFMALMLVVAALVVGGLKQSKADTVQTRQPTLSPSSTAVTSVTPTTSHAEVPTRKLETAANPIVAPGVTMPKVTCELPKLHRAQEKLEAFHSALIPCLERAWHPILTQVGEPRIPVAVNVHDVKNTACGPAPSPDEAMGFYCWDGATIFLPLPRQLEDGDPPKILELSRRFELQADCFSAMFLANAAGRGSIGAGMVTQPRQSTFENSDTHGSSKSASLWQKRGLAAKDTSACNTFVAPAKEVS
ncbi:neutral zinc metallopeptidase [Amycolatopsis thailandensis]|uniref:YpfJ protein, zinc metalloprotease superfamily n=1 Tax=Amycolatopsis thailandensis TaxID=589330 RepID=UPI00362FB643